MSRNAFPQLEAEYNRELEQREIAQQERQTDRMWSDMADMVNAMLTRRTVRWICPYCGTEVPDEQTPHCGEVHCREMTPEEE